MLQLQLQVHTTELVTLYGMYYLLTESN